MYFIAKTENGELTEYDSVPDYENAMNDAAAWNDRNDNENSLFSAYVFKVLSNSTLQLLHTFGE